MDIARPALIANIPGLQTPLIARSGGHTFSHADISGNARVHFGDVFNVSNDQPQPVREQPFTVPFCRDESFIPRDTVVEDLLKKGNGERHARAALYGLGGVGYAFSHSQVKECADFTEKRKLLSSSPTRIEMHTPTLRCFGYSPGLRNASLNHSRELQQTSTYPDTTTRPQM